MTEFHLTTKYDADTLNAVLADVEAGTSIGQAAKAHGVSYSPAWQWVSFHQKLAAGTLQDMRGTTDAAKAKAVAKLRDEGESWGEIMTTLCLTEGQVRRAYERATNVQSVGTRVGRGGRFWGDEQGEALYADDRQASGVAVEPGTTLPGALATVVREPADMKMPALRAAIRAIDPEAKLPKGKADLVAMLTKLQNG